MTLKSWPLGLLLLLPVNSAAQDHDTPTITITGTHSLRVQPDQAILDFTIDSRGEKVTNVAEDNRRKVADVIKFAQESGIKPESIRTESLQIRPLFPAKLQQQKSQNPFGDAAPAPPQNSITPGGYSVQRRLRIEVRQLKRFENLYEGLIERGVNQVEQIRFESSKQKELQEQARLHAIRDAKHKAETMVDELGAALEGVQTIDEQGGSRYGAAASLSSVMGDPFGGSSLPSAITAGEIEIRSSVRIVFRMKETQLD